MLLDPGSISIREWRKHLSVDAVYYEGDVLTYHGRNCPDPARDHSVRAFVKDIRNEVANVRDELLARLGLPNNDPRLKLRLPEVKADIRPKLGAYVYEDLQFRSDHEEIIKLLMGTALYGNPELAIRELLQNSLDALELRDLRLQYFLKTSNESSPGTRPDGTVRNCPPGHFIDKDDAEYEFQVQLTWGHDPGKGYWIQVEDNGVGMSRDTIRRFFTTLGKSFYRSEDFKREAAALREAGFVCSPISQFGIGVLSSFMLADRIEVRTCCGGSDADRATDFHVSGPGTLFWVNNGTRKLQGTEVRLWLKPAFTVEHDWDECLELLRRFFEYAPRTHQGNDAGRIDPVFAAASSVVWPKYPIVLGSNRRRLDEHFHPTVLAPIDLGQLRAKAAEWNITLPEESVIWKSVDWVDDKGAEATGSRIRVWQPSFPSESTTVPLWVLGALTAGQMIGDRAQDLVRSMYVPDAEALSRSRTWGPGVGIPFWLDVRGDASPALSADRRKVLSAADRPWRKSLEGVFRRWAEFCAGDASRLLLSIGPAHRKGLATSLKTGPGIRRFGTGFQARHSVPFDGALLLQSLAWERDRDGQLVRDVLPEAEVPMAYEDAQYRNFVLSRARKLVRNPPDIFRVEIDHARIMSLGLPVAVELAAAWWNTAGIPIPSACLVQEGYSPQLNCSWPPLGVSDLDDALDDCSLVGPGVLSILGSDHTTRIRSLKYDRCFPFSAVPIGDDQWTGPHHADRRLRRYCMLPFLFPMSRDFWAGGFTRMFAQYSALTEICILIPAYDLWYVDFNDWSAEDWGHPGHVCLLYENLSGETKIVHKRGVVSREIIRTEGRPYLEYVETFLGEFGIKIPDLRPEVPVDFRRIG